jgi:hypothetical protein
MFFKNQWLRYENTSNDMLIGVRELYSIQKVHEVGFVRIALPRRSAIGRPTAVTAEGRSLVTEPLLLANAQESITATKSYQNHKSKAYL